MPKLHSPREFHADVVAAAHQAQAPLKQLAKDFGISAGCLSNWRKTADVVKPRSTDESSGVSVP